MAMPQAKRRLELAEEMIAERRYGEGVRLLGSLLESNEDFFFKPQSDQPVFRSLKAEAGRLLGGLPEAGRASYELQFGAQARQMLGEAAAASDPAQVAEVARRFSVAVHENFHLSGPIVCNRIDMPSEPFGWPTYYYWPPLGTLVDGQVYMTPETADEHLLVLGPQSG